MRHYMISRPINGIPLNGKEYLMTENGKSEKLFCSKSEARQFLTTNGVKVKDLWIYDIEEVK